MFVDTGTVIPEIIVDRKSRYDGSSCKRLFDCLFGIWCNMNATPKFYNGDYNSNCRGHPRRRKGSRIRSLLRDRGASPVGNSYMPRCILRIPHMRRGPVPNNQDSGSGFYVQFLSVLQMPRSPRRPSSSRNNPGFSPVWYSRRYCSSSPASPGVKPDRRVSGPLGFREGCRWAGCRENSEHIPELFIRQCRDLVLLRSPRLLAGLDGMPDLIEFIRYRF